MPAASADILACDPIAVVLLQALACAAWRRACTAALLVWRVDSPLGVRQPPERKSAVGVKYTASRPRPSGRRSTDADAKSAGCVTCHTGTDRHTMHANPGVMLGCTDCHGGDATVMKPKDAEYKGKDDSALRAWR